MKAACYYLNLLLMSDILQAFWVSKPILSTSFLNQEVTCSPADRAQMTDKTRVGQRGGFVLGLSEDMQEKKRRLVTWSAQLAVLLFLTSIHLHAPGMEGEGEEVLQARGRSNHHIQALQPLLTLLKGRELTPGNTKGKVCVCVRIYIYIHIYIYYCIIDF